ncbi:PREDICTED: cuticle collagen 40 [Chinchilla lanigera]|uniref:cuticle collagen 40 n=1 Tax=Chinchilla lanigera TaxID=34839 RepID=UPI0006965B67|nr:PREDICTED: cuticle collagen 40 [Chinchilla lanigera]
MEVKLVRPRGRGAGQSTRRAGAARRPGRWGPGRDPDRAGGAGAWAGGPAGADAGVPAHSRARTLTFQVRRRPSSLPGSGTSAPPWGRRCGSRENQKSAAVARLPAPPPARPLPRGAAPTTPGGGGQLAPLPRAHGAASAAGVDTDSDPEPPLLPTGRRRRPLSRQPACPSSPRLPGTSARRRLRTSFPPAPLVARRKLALPIGPALTLNGPMGTAVSGRHRDRCC